MFGHESTQCVGEPVRRYFHTHALGDGELGSYDEFYYVLEGPGVMDTDGRRLPVTAGDHVFTPIGIPHGVRNTAARGNVKVFLTAVERTNVRPETNVRAAA